MHRSLSIIVFTSLRLAAAGIVAVAIWIPLSFVLGLVVVPLALKSSAVMSVAVGLSGVLTFGGAGYVSARFITPGSYLHAGAAAFLITLIWALSTSTGPRYVALYSAFGAAGFALAGAWIARRHAAPPNNAVERTQER